MRKKGKTITWKERQKIEQLVRIDLSISQIAEEIGVTRAAIYVELKRGGTHYSADVAHKNVGA